MWEHLRDYGFAWGSLILFVGAFYFAIADSHKNRTDPERIAEREERILDGRQDIVDNLDYFQDSRTGFCFAMNARYREGFMAHVPCEGIPADLLNK